MFCLGLRDKSDILPLSTIQLFILKLPHICQVLIYFVNHAGLGLKLIRFDIDTCSDVIFRMQFIIHRFSF